MSELINSSILQNLRDWHSPDLLSWWPPAPGWWLLSGFFLLIIGWLTHFWLQNTWRDLILRKHALSQLRIIETEFMQTGDHRRFVAALSRLIRRLAFIKFPRTQIASLYGTDWLEFLDQISTDINFNRKLVQILVFGPYCANTSNIFIHENWNPQQLTQLVLYWIKILTKKPSYQFKISLVLKKFIQKQLIKYKIYFKSYNF